MANGPGGREVGRISVRVVPDTTGFRAQLRRDLEAIRETLKVDVDLDTEGAKAHMRALLAELRAIAAGGIDVDVDVNRGALERLAALFRGVSRDAGMASGATQNFNASMFGMSRGMLIFTAVMLLAAPAIGTVAALLAGLPSLAMAGAGAFAAIKLGMDGIKDAAKAFAEPLKNLKASLSDTFREGLTPVFQKLAGALPQLEGGLNRIARGLIDMARGFTDVVTSGAGMYMLQDILKNTGKFFSDLTPAVQHGTLAFLTLADQGSRAFGYLSKTLNDFAGRFDLMVQSWGGDGVMDSAMKGLSSTLDGLLNMFLLLMDSGMRVMGTLGPQMGSFFTNLGVLFAALMPPLAALSGAILDVLGQLALQLAPIIEKLTPGFTKLVEVIGDGLVAALQILGPILQPIADILSDVILAFFKEVSPYLPAVKESFAEFGEALRKGFADPKVKEGFISIAESLGKIAGKVVELLPLVIDFGAKLAKPFADAAPALVVVAGAILGVKVAMGLLNAVMAVNPFVLIAMAVAGLVVALVYAYNHCEKFREIVQKAWEGIKTVVSEVWEGYLKPTLAALWEGLQQIGQAFVDAFTSPEMQDGINTFKEGFQKVWEVIQPVLPALWDIGTVIMEVLITAVKQVIEWLPKVVEQFAALWQIIEPILIPILRVLAGTIKETASWLKDHKEQIQKVIEKTGEWIGRILDVITALTRVLGEIVGWVVNAIGEFNKLGMWFVELPGKIVGAFRNGGTMLYQFGVDMIQGLINGAGSLLSRIGEFFLDKIPGWIKGPFKAALGINSPSRVFHGYGVNLGEGLINGMQSQTRQLASASKGMAAAITDNFDISDVQGKWDKAAAEAKLADVPKNFLEATGKGILSDLGISDQGALGQLVTQLTQVIYQVQDFDEAQRAEDRRKEKESKQYTTR